MLIQRKLMPGIMSIGLIIIMLFSFAAPAFAQEPALHACSANDALIIVAELSISDIYSDILVQTNNGLENMFWTPSPAATLIELHQTYFEDILPTLPACQEVQELSDQLDRYILYMSTTFAFGFSIESLPLLEREQMNNVNSYLIGGLREVYGDFENWLDNLLESPNISPDTVQDIPLPVCTEEEKSEALSIIFTSDLFTESFSAPEQNDEDVSLMSVVEVIEMHQQYFEGVEPELPVCQEVQIFSNRLDRFIWYMAATFSLSYASQLEMAAIDEAPLVRAGMYMTDNLQATQADISAAIALLSSSD